MATRFLPMSWRSPLTVPMTTMPRGLTPALARWGSSLASPAFMARAATRTSGMKTSLFLNWTPRRSIPGMSPSFRIVPAGIPAARALSTRASTSAFFPAIRASCISLSISTLLTKNARPSGPLSENERKAHGKLEHGVPDRSGGHDDDVQRPRVLPEDVGQTALVSEMDDETHPPPWLGDRPGRFDDQAEIRLLISVGDITLEPQLRFPGVDPRLELGLKPHGRRAEE